jgi:hypothetical protein
MRKNAESTVDFARGVSGFLNIGGWYFASLPENVAEITHSLDHGELPEKSNARNDRRTRFESLRE